MRIILDIDTVKDANKALSLALENVLSQYKEFGHWSSVDPDFSALVRKTKTGVSVKTSRKA